MIFASSPGWVLCRSSFFSMHTIFLASNIYIYILIYIYIYIYINSFYLFYLFYLYILFVLCIYIYI